MKKGLAYPLFSFRNRVLIIVLGLVIGISSLLFTNDMARQLREKEQNEVAIWSAAFRDLGVNPSSPLLSALINSKSNIPFIIVDGQMNIASSHLIPDHILNHPNLRRKKIEEMAAANSFIQVTTMNNETFYIFYDESRLLKTLVYFPYIQLMIIVVFVTFGYITFRSSKQDEQNRVWIGLAKETAHQLGTPTSSLLGWIEYLRTQPIDQTAVEEMNKDIIRLTKVVDRFSKIGAATPLSEGVINNLLKNAMDALQGKGTIDVRLSDDANWVYIDVKDTGKGIAKGNFKRIFDPGFTTKTRGWGLGLSLSKRIIEGYHGGRIYVLDSEIDKGTTIRVALKKIYT